jgi:hypothetical protein
VFGNAEILEVAAYARLRRVEALGAQQAHELGLARDRLALEKLGNSAAACLLLGDGSWHRELIV